MSERIRHDHGILRIASSVPATGSNPYVRLFYSALRPHGVELVGTFEPTQRWLNEHMEQFDILHFHWPEWVIRTEPDWLRSIQGFPGSWHIRSLLGRALPWARIHEYQEFLRLAGASRKLIAWTCHNVEAHEDATWPIRAAFRSLASSADLVICHDQAASARCASLYSPPGRIVVMPHGNYDGVYPAARPRHEVLREVGLPADVPLLLCVGQVRPYKGTDIACEAVARLGTRVSLLIAGTAAVASYERRIKGILQSIPNGAFITRELTEQEFSDFVGASDAVLLPYRSLTGSGAALAALTLGRGVIASDLPFFADLVRGHANAGRVFASGDAGSLAEAIPGFLEVPAAQRERAALDLASQFTWSRLVPPVARDLRDLLAAK